MRPPDAKMLDVRTTVRIDDELLRSVKQQAARSGRTVGAVIEDALRVAMSARHDGPPRLSPLPTYGTSGVLPGVDLASNAALREVMESSKDVDALR